MLRVLRPSCLILGMLVATWAFDRSGGDEVLFPAPSSELNAVTGGKARRHEFWPGAQELRVMEMLVKMQRGRTGT